MQLLPLLASLYASSVMKVVQDRKSLATSTTAISTSQLIVEYICLDPRILLHLFGDRLEHCRGRRK